mmetsp:Transcript_2341/g.8375  ORF Transcript_2341/g.8375 Transcript_2341/m.8375 type:complete len:477 (-) Transcript_2341:1874-3304(-)
MFATAPLRTATAVVAPQQLSERKSSCVTVARRSRTPTVCMAGRAGKWKAMELNDDIDEQRSKEMVNQKFQMGTNAPDVYQGDSRANLSKLADSGFYIAPAFLDKLTVHIAKNFVKLPKVKVPLILGIWGGKGQGKSFQTELAFAKLGINPITMSAGELESGNAGEPAKLVRQRYREAADIITKGQMCALFINDLDAGAGRMGGSTQYTVNNQMVNATLMNIADNPTNVQLPGVYQNDEIPRVPIVTTGNDFSTLYAPLIRDGRMEKFYWSPTREDRIGIACGIFQSDGVSRSDVETLVDTFPGQSIDFFGALRARVYDDKVREFISETGIENLGGRLVNSRQGKPQFSPPAMSIQILLNYGHMLTQEQDNVAQVQLSRAYLSGAELPGSDQAGLSKKEYRSASYTPPPASSAAPSYSSQSSEPSRYSSEPASYSPEPSRYSPEPSRYSPEPSRYSPEPSYTSEPASHDKDDAFYSW